MIWFKASVRLISAFVLWFALSAPLLPLSAVAARRQRDLLLLCVSPVISALTIVAKNI